MLQASTSPSIGPLPGVAPNLSAWGAGPTGLAPPPSQPQPGYLQPPSLAPYTSSRLPPAGVATDHPAPQASPPTQSGFQPILGLNHLEPGAAPRVNHARLSSSQSTQASRPAARAAAGSSSTRRPRTRGVAQPAPVLPRPADAHIIPAAGNGGEDLVKIKCQVYPAPVSRSILSIDPELIVAAD